MLDSSSKLPKLDYAGPPPPRLRSAPLYGILGLLAGLFGLATLLLGIFGMLPPYYDEHGRVAFNGEVVFNMSELAIVGALCWFLSFRWIRVAMKSRGKHSQ
jgi:hypothetical protein